MKSSLRKLRGFAAHHQQHRGDSTEKKGPQAKQDELLQATKDMEDMRDIYEGLLSAAAATANSAYEFSEALQEMGTCLLQKTSLNEDEESGWALLMLGKRQFGLQKLLDSYRAHIIQTITTPSESLLKELQIVEEMKRQCDYKRDLYNNMLVAHREKAKSKNTKGETVSLEQLQSAQEEYDEEASLFVFRLESLKKGQSRSLLTQAARHYAAQLNFFKKGLKILEDVEPHVKVISEQQHIDYQFSGLEDNSVELGDDDDDYNYVESGDGELSFDYGQIDLGRDVHSGAKNLMELDQVDDKKSATLSVESSQYVIDKSQAEILNYNRGHTTMSQSAPLLPNRKVETSDKAKETQPSSRQKFLTYALPTPNDAKLPPTSSRNSFSVNQFQKSGWPSQLWHSSPLEPDKFQQNEKRSSGKTPPPLAEELPQQKIKRQAMSGPLTNMDSRHSVDLPAMKSASKMHIAPPRRSISPRVSPSSSPPPVLSPKISELHELPRPPPVSAMRSTRPPTLIGHSAPLVSRAQELSTASKILTMASKKASPLPIPPKSIARSFSIPSSGQRTPISGSGKPPDMMEGVASPPLKPISLTSSQVSSNTGFV